MPANKKPSTEEKQARAQANKANLPDILSSIADEAEQFLSKLKEEIGEGNVIDKPVASSVACLVCDWQDKVYTYYKEEGFEEGQDIDVTLSLPPDTSKLFHMSRRVLYE